MENTQKGFAKSLLIAIIALLVIGGSVYIYKNKKAEAPTVVDNTAQQVEILNSLVISWKTVGPGTLPGLPPLRQAFYGYPNVIQLIGNNHVVISYQNDFNPLFAVLSYDLGSKHFTYVDGHGTPDFVVSEALWNTWRSKYGDMAYVPQTYQFSSTRTGDVVYPSDWKLMIKNPFISP